MPDKDAGVGTLLHEIAHALEMLHKCGLADVTEECACCVSYKTDWLLDVEGKPQKWKKLPRGYRLCYKHRNNFV